MPPRKYASGGSRRRLLLQSNSDGPESGVDLGWEAVQGRHGDSGLWQREEVENFKEKVLSLVSRSSRTGRALGAWWRALYLGT